MTDTKLTQLDFSAHDLELITEWTGDYFGKPGYDPFKLNRALYVLGHRKLGIDTKSKYENTRPLNMRGISTWVDAHWDIRDDPDGEVESEDESPKAGPNSETN